MKSEIDRRYGDTIKRMTSLVFPDLPESALARAYEWSINKRYKREHAELKNNYTKTSTGILLKDLTDYILEKEPIATSWGVLFKKHGTVPNPIADMIKGFMDARGIHKSQMFEYPKGSEEYAKFFMLQLLDKLDANASYGVLSNSSCMMYNIYVAASITSMGRELISTATMFFEMFLSNGVKFASLNEIITYIDNIVVEKPERHYDDNLVLDKNITPEECFAKIMYSVGDFRFGTIKWVPTFEDCDIVWTMINRLSQEDINRLYYKNNLYAFMDNQVPTRAIIYLLKSLKTPYLDPNTVPKEIEVELDAFQDMLAEYVYYHYQIIDKVDRCNNMIKNVSVVSDTDSAIVCLDGWYQYVKEKTKGIPMDVKKIYVNAFRYIDGDAECMRAFNYLDPVEDYDFVNDEIVDIYRSLKPWEIIPPDNLRYSIINIMSYICTNLCNDYLERFTKVCGSWSEDRKCMIYLKNEFLFKRLLLTYHKKNYASKQEIQEGHFVPEKESLDIKGLPINKSTLPDRTKEELQKILYEDILNTPMIDQLKIIKDLTIYQKKIYQSLEAGEKDFYKPVQIKSMSAYEDPMRIQGIKASVLWNELRGDRLDAIDLSQRNKVDIVKVNINPETAEKVKDKYPEVYERLQHVFANDKKSAGFTALALPTNVAVPDWVREFIDYQTIINDNTTNFPIDSVGISNASSSNISYTNMIRI